MNEKDVMKGSYFLLVLGSIIFVIVGLVLHDFSYLTGYLLGYVINVIIFGIIVKSCELILHVSANTTIMIILMNILKLVIYAIGFLIAVKSSYVHIVGVFFGYMVTKLSIYLEGFKHKGGEA